MTYTVVVFNDKNTKIELFASGSRVPDVGERIFVYLNGRYYVGEVVEHHA